MPKGSRKNPFIVPFSQSDTNKVPQITNDGETKEPVNVAWSTNWSPVHIGRHTQSITPATKRKIKHRFCHGLRSQHTSTHSSTRDISPGLCVPIEFSQTSYMSDIPDDETVVCDDMKEAKESVAPIAEKPPNKKWTPDANIDQGFELEIEYNDTTANILSGDICNQSQDAYNMEVNELHGNRGELEEVKLFAEKVYNSTIGISPCEHLNRQNYHSDQTLRDDSNQYMEINRIYEHSNVLQVIDGINTDKVHVNVEDEPTKLTSVNTTGNCQSNTSSDNIKQRETKKGGKTTFKNRNIKLPHKKVCLQNLKKNTKGKGTSRQKETNKLSKNTTQIKDQTKLCKRTKLTNDKMNKLTVQTTLNDNMTNKPQLDGSRVKQRIKQRKTDGVSSQDMLRKALKTTSKSSRRKPTITTCESIRQDVLKVMFKLHEEILELQHRRKQLIIESGGVVNIASPLNTDSDVAAEKVRLEGITEE